MALVATKLTSDYYLLKYLLAHDGGTGSDTITIANATILADLALATPAATGSVVATGHPIDNLFSRVYADQAAARAAISEGRKCNIWIQNRSEAGAGNPLSVWEVDVDVDATPGFATIVVGVKGDVGIALKAILIIEARHSTGR